MVQISVAREVTVPLIIVHAPGVRLLKVTANPELASAMQVLVLVETDRGVQLKTMIWLPLFIVTVCAAADAPALLSVNLIKPAIVPTAVGLPPIVKTSLLMPLGTAATPAGKPVLNQV